MAEIPKTLEDAIAQAREATQAAIAAGKPRLLVEFVYPELKVMPVAEAFFPLFQEMGLTFKVFFPDAGAAALAKRDWNNPDFTIRGIGELKAQIEPDDEAFLFVEPSSVEVNTVEGMCNQAIGRPVVMLQPRLEDVSTIGIGYAGRQLRERFLSTLESAYYLRPMDGSVLFRCFPDPWQIWAETESDYELLAELPQKPSAEAMQRILIGQESTDDSDASPSPQRQRGGFLSELQSFIRALTQ